LADLHSDGRSGTKVVLFSRALIFFLLGLAAIGAGCRSETFPALGGVEHSEAHYAFLFGQPYRTKADLYIFAFTRETEPIFYLGAWIDGVPFGPKYLPRDVSADNVGKVYRVQDSPDDVIIADVVPAGAILTIRAETHEVTWLSGVRGSGGYPMGFICDIVHNGKTNSVLSEFIQSHKQVAGKVPNQDISDAVAEKLFR